VFCTLLSSALIYVPIADEDYLLYKLEIAEIREIFSRGLKHISLTTDYYQCIPFFVCLCILGHSLLSFSVVANKNQHLFIKAGIVIIWIALLLLIVTGSGTMAMFLLLKSIIFILFSVATFIICNKQFSPKLLNA
jgi:hypothetical protein